MKSEDRKEYPDFEGFTPDGWELLDEKDYPDFLKEVIAEAKENIKRRGGARAGSGRPVGTKKTKTKQIRLPQDIADWIQSDRNKTISIIRRLITES